MRLSNAIIVVLVVGFVGFVFYSLLRVEPLEISGGRIEHRGNQVFVTGTVTNTGSKPQVAALELKLYDASGHLITRQNVRSGLLQPGQSQQFSSPPISALEADKFTVQVDRGNNMYGN